MQLRTFNLEIDYPIYGAKFVDDSTIVVVGGYGDVDPEIGNKITALKINFKRKHKKLKKFRELNLPYLFEYPCALDTNGEIILVGFNEEVYNEDQFAEFPDFSNLRKYTWDNEHLVFDKPIDLFKNAEKFSSYVELCYISDDGAVGAASSSNQRAPKIIIFDPIALTVKFTVASVNNLKVADMHISPDGKLLCYVTKDSFEAISSITGRSLLKCSDFGNQIEKLSHIRFLSNNEVLIAGSLKNKGVCFILYSVSKMQILKVQKVSAKIRNITSLDYCPIIDPTTKKFDLNNSLIGFSGDDDSLHIVRYKGFKTIATYTKVQSNITKVTFSPTGEYLASVASDKTINLVKIPTEELISSGNSNIFASVFYSIIGLIFVGIIGVVIQFVINKRVFNDLLEQIKKNRTDSSAYFTMNEVEDVTKASPNSKTYTSHISVIEEIVYDEKLGKSTVQLNSQALTISQAIVSASLTASTIAKPEVIVPVSDTKSAFTEIVILSVVSSEPLTASDMPKQEPSAVPEPQTAVVDSVKSIVEPIVESISSVVAPIVTPIVEPVKSIVESVLLPPELSEKLVETPAQTVEKPSQPLAEPEIDSVTIQPSPVDPIKQESVAETGGVPTTSTPISPPVTPKEDLVEIVSQEESIESIPEELAPTKSESSSAIKGSNAKSSATSTSIIETNMLHSGPTPHPEKSAETSVSISQSIIFETITRVVTVEKIETRVADVTSEPALESTPKLTPELKSEAVLQSAATEPVPEPEILAESETADSKTIDSKTIDSKTAERKLTDSKTAESKTTDSAAEPAEPLATILPVGTPILGSVEELVSSVVEPNVEQTVKETEVTTVEQIVTPLDTQAVEKLAQSIQPVADVPVNTVADIVVNPVADTVVESVAEPAAEPELKPETAVPNLKAAEPVSQPEVVSSQSEVSSVSKKAISVTPEVVSTSQPEVVSTSQPEVVSTSQPEVVSTSQPEVISTSHPKGVSSKPEVVSTQLGIPLAATEVVSVVKPVDAVQKQPAEKAEETKNSDLHVMEDAFKRVREELKEKLNQEIIEEPALELPSTQVPEVPISNTLVEDFSKTETPIPEPLESVVSSKSPESIVPPFVEDPVTELPTIEKDQSSSNESPTEEAEKITTSATSHSSSSIIQPETVRDEL